MLRAAGKLWVGHVPDSAGSAGWERGKQAPGSADGKGVSIVGQGVWRGVGSRVGSCQGAGARECRELRSGGQVPVRTCATGCSHSRGADVGVHRHWLDRHCWVETGEGAQIVGGGHLIPLSLAPLQRYRR